MQNTPDILFMVYAPGMVALLGFAAWRDIATRTIPNSVSLALIAIGAGTRLFQGWEPFGVSMLVASCVFVLLLPLCGRGLLGGADLKLLAALATGLPPLASFQLLADVTIVGGVLALLYLLLHRLLCTGDTRTRGGSRASSLFMRIVNVEAWRIRRGCPLPYGIAIAIGAAFAVLNRQGV